MQLVHQLLSSNHHLRRNLRNGTCLCGGNGHENVLSSPTMLIRLRKVSSNEEEVAGLYRLVLAKVGEKWGF